ncbi:MAG: DUF2341 domain-containing protein, partial [Chitinispirillaceae bacterium]|nr:DUF2341 domain-containing protein [Chitinispirillaceae bacterium]
MKKNCFPLPVWATVLVLFPATGMADDYLQWNHSSPVYLNTTAAGANVTGDVTRFPVLVRLHPGNFSYFPQTLAGGADIRFAKTNGSHLPYQIERWVDGAGDNDTAEIWVRIDTVYGDNAVQLFVMYWGKTDAVDSSNSGAVFDTANGFAGVWHLDESPGGGMGNIKDATKNANHATSSGAMTGADLVDGVIYKGHNFDGTDDGDSAAQTPSLNISGPITVSAWFKANTLGNNARICTKSHTSNAPPYSMYSLGLDASGALRGELALGGTQYTVNGSSALSTSVFYHAVFTYDGFTMKLFLNGIQEGNTTSQAGTITTNSKGLTIGKAGYNAYYFNGIVDEVTLSKTARTPEWIKLCFENQKTGQTLVRLPQHLSWDVVATAGIQAGNGTWGTNDYWTLSSGDGTILGAWPGAGTSATFAGSDGTWTITVSGTQSVDSLTFLSSGNTLNGGTSIDFGTGKGIYVAAGKSATITTPIYGTGGLSKSGIGELTLAGTNMYTGNTTVSAGALTLNGTIAASSAVTVEGGATLGGTGTVGGSVSANGNVSPGMTGTGILTIGNNLTFTGSGSCSGTLNGTAAGTSYDQIVMSNGTLTLGSATLALTLGYAPSASDAYTIIDNAGSNAVSGTFNGMTEGDTIILFYGGTNYLFDVTYTGGTGNDVVITCLGIAVPDDYGSWSYSKPIMLNTTSSGANVTGNVLNFPVLVRLDPDNFQFFNQTLPGGADIRFAKNDGTHLPYQIERWVDEVSDNDTAEIWVKIDTVYGNNATQSFIMLWGKAGAADSSMGGAVFGTSNGFKGVWHLGEEGNTTALDATSGGNDGTSNGFSTSSDAAGVIGISREFNGTTDYLQLNNSLLKGLLSAGNKKTTISFWVKADATTATKMIVWEGNSAANGWGVEEELHICFGADPAGTVQDNYLTLYLGDTDDNATPTGNMVHATTPYSDISGWHYAAVTLDNFNGSTETAILYLDGMYVTTDVGDVTTTFTGWNIYTRFGRAGVADRYFDGKLDEITIADTARSPDWIKLSYENQRHNQSLVKIFKHYSWDLSTSPGIFAGSGTWGVDDYWTGDGSTLGAWPGVGHSATFGGADGSYNVTVSGTQNVDSLCFLNSGYTLSGGTIDLGYYNGISIDNTKTATIGSVISGTAGLFKYGGGTLVLTGSNTYTGSTIVGSGSLVLDGITPPGDVTVYAGGTLSGGGTVSGALTIQNDGALAPGNGGTGTLTVNTLSLNGTSVLQFDVGTTYDSIAVLSAGGLYLDGTLDVAAAAGFGVGTYPLISYTGTLTDNGLIVNTAPGGYEYTPFDSASVVWLRVVELPARVWTGAGADKSWSSTVNWQGSIVPDSSDSVVFPNGTPLCSLYTDVKVRCLMFETTYSGTFYLNGRKLSIIKDFEMPISGTIVGNGSDTICFDGTETGTFRPKSGILLPTIQRKGSGTTTVVTEAFQTNNLIINGGTFNLGSGLVDTVHGLLKVQGGTLDFSSSALYAKSDVDFRGAADLPHSGGKLHFKPAALQYFFPANEVVNPNIVHEGAGSLRVHENRLRVGRLDVNSGQLILDTALFADTVAIISSATLQLDTMAGNSDTVNVLQGTGILNFGKTLLHVPSSLNMSGFGSVGDTGSLAFFGTDQIDFTPKSGYLFRKIVKLGTGTVRVGSPLKTAKLFINDGTWDWYTSTIDTVIDTIGIAGGTMKLSNSTVYAEDMTSSGGELRFNTGTLTIISDTGIVQLSALSAVFSDTGLLTFNGTGASIFEFQQNPAHAYPVIRIEGNAADTVYLMSDINAKCLRQTSSTLKWGSGLSHTVDTLDGTGGVMDFGSSTVTVTVGNVNLAGLSGIAGTGILSFVGTTGTQVLTPPSALSCPSITKTGAGTVQVGTNNLICKGLSVNAGTFNFAGLNATINGNFTVTSGSTTTFGGLDGITVSVSGNASLSGQSGNLLNLDPTTAWNLNVTGTLDADYASIANCTAGSSTGQATATCVDNGGNTNWYFPDILPPTGCSVVIIDNNGYTSDADPALTITATDADSMRLGLAADTASLLWKIYSSIDSIDISVGGEGGKRIFAQFKDIAG